MTVQSKNLSNHIQIPQVPPHYLVVYLCPTGVITTCTNPAPVSSTVICTCATPCNLPDCHRWYHHLSQPVISSPVIRSSTTPGNLPDCATGDITTCASLCPASVTSSPVICSSTSCRVLVSSVSIFCTHRKTHIELCLGFICFNFLHTQKNMHWARCLGFTCLDFLHKQKNMHWAWCLGFICTNFLHTQKNMHWTWCLNWFHLFQFQKTMP